MEVFIVYVEKYNPISLGAFLYFDVLILFNNVYTAIRTYYNCVGLEPYDTKVMSILLSHGTECSCNIRPVHSHTNLLIFQSNMCLYKYTKHKHMNDLLPISPIRVFSLGNIR